MDKTPKVSKFLVKQNNFTTDVTNESRFCSTPVSNARMYHDIENDESPVHIACTQEGCDVDVVWDWNSPQAKPKPRKAQKRLLLPQSPKVPVKRYPSNNQIQNFEKLREELQSLKEAIAVVDNEVSLVLSPEEEENECKDVNNEDNRNDVPPSTQELYMGINDEDDLFNDSADEVLIQCTQRIEADLATSEKNINPYNIDINKSDEDKKNIYSNKDIRNMGNSNPSFQPTKIFNRDAVGDSFTEMLKKVDVDHLELNKSDHNESIKNTKKRFTFSRTSSENKFKTDTNIGKVEFHRTQSFESTVEYRKEIIPQHKLDEIERKRKEALAKLELKKRQDHSDSPSKCSPEEIEQKRLQALAKLEAKRQQEIIDRKRKEALKRLELSRKKNAMVVKSSLSKRL